MKIYVVTMYRMGERTNSSYVLGTFSSLNRAKEAARTESTERGFKYGYGIAQCELDVVDDEDDELDVIINPHDRAAWEADAPDRNAKLPTWTQAVRVLLKSSSSCS